MISFVVAAYNVEKYIAECLESIICQTDSTYEVIVVDDGSSDNTPSICDRYANECNKIRVFHLERSGVSTARNIGIRNASGEWICFVDGDDAISSNTVQAFNKKTNSNADVIYGGYKEVFENDFDYNKLNIDLKCKAADLSIQQLQEQCIYTYPNEASFSIRVATPWAKIYRRDFLINHNILFDVRGVFSQDVMFNLLALQYCTKVAYLDEIVYFYRVNFSGARGKYSKDLNTTIVPIIEAIVENSRLNKNSLKQLKERLGIRVFLLIYKLVHCDCCHIENKKRYSIRKSEFFRVYNNNSVQLWISEVNAEKLHWQRRVAYRLISSNCFGLLCIYERMLHLKSKWISK